MWSWEWFAPDRLTQHRVPKSTIWEKAWTRAIWERFFRKTSPSVAPTWEDSKNERISIASRSFYFLTDLKNSSSNKSWVENFENSRRNFWISDFKNSISDFKFPKNVITSRWWKNSNDIHTRTCSARSFHSLAVSLWWSCKRLFSIVNSFTLSSCTATLIRFNCNSWTFLKKM